jgi:hypothetical protein
MTQQTIQALLGRSLSPAEVTNFDLYLELAEEALSGLICTSIDDVTEQRTFTVREGYSTAFVDILRSVSEVEIDGNAVTNYSLRQWDKSNGTWYNSLVFDERFSNASEIKVTGVWGFATVPADLQMVIAGLFDLTTKKNKYDPTIKSKRVEDFQIQFADQVDQDVEFRNKHAQTLSKYSLCTIGYVRHGEVC